MTTDELTAARLNAGHSIRSFAEEIGVPEPTIRRLESGLGIHPKYAKRVADFFGVQVTDLPTFSERTAA